MNHNQLDTLIHMANQIADNNSHYGSEAEAAERVRVHLKKFWARSMKQQIVDYLRQDGSQLSSIAKAAITKLNPPSNAQLKRGWNEAVGEFHHPE